MTCVSERSGRASSAMWLIDQAPRKIAAPVRDRTMNRFRAENEMIFSIMGSLSRSMDVHGGRLLPRRFAGLRGRHPRQGCLEPRLGVDQEVRLRHDLFPRSDPLPDFPVAVDPRAGLDLARLEAPLPLRNEDD